jgi:carotenoid 1,2-hydratase
VFSPYYIAAAKADPENHVALNVALYGQKARWTMTERGRENMARDRDSIAIGPSRMHWNGDCLVIDIAEHGAVFGQPVRGQVRIYPEALVQQGFDLDAAGRHRWQPVATRARIEVSLPQPGTRWAGAAYVDSNFGTEPMEDRFTGWQWSRAHTGADTAIFYEGGRVDGSRFALALAVDRDGTAQPMAAPPRVALRPTGWLMPRHTRADAASHPRILKTWEDAPFYSRSALATTIHGEPALGVHESLSLTRFANPVVQRMLPYRMPRKA